jgi:uncharacterized protein (DUF1810 family)
MEQSGLDKKLEEFVIAQDLVYDQVLLELRAGKKQTHWIWFIFPQLAGLGTSSVAKRFGIGSQAEAKSYLEHADLGMRLRECTRLMLAVPHNDIGSIMGYPDDLKFRSCMTLFAAVGPPEEEIFEEALNKFFGGERDPLTLKLLNEEG